MKVIRQILSFLFLPVMAYGQTVHVDEGRIVYKGTVTVANINQGELFARANNALNDVPMVKGSSIEEHKDKGMIVATGKIRLATPYHLIRTIEFVFELSAEDGRYKYRIDSVYMKQKERGGKTIKISSEKLLKEVEVTGPEAIEAEKMLNEIDMNFQKLLALVNADMKKTALASGGGVRGN